MKKQFTILITMLLSIYAFGQQKLEPLDIGDKLPNIKFENVLNHPDGEISISDYKGKLLILDFWATWCAPCVASFPKLDSLDKAFGDDLAILPVTYQSQEEVEKLFSRMSKLKEIKKPMVYGDNTLRELFPHSSLPYYVWIDQEGRVFAFTYSDEVNSINIQNAVNGDYSEIRNDKQQANVFEKSISLRDQIPELSESIYQSGLWGYIPGFPSMASISTYFEKGDHNIRIYLTNVPLTVLFRYGHRDDGKSLNSKNVDVRIKDDFYFKDLEKMSTTEMTEWTKNYTFTYELEVAREHKDKIWDIFKADLGLMFPQYKTEKELRVVPCYALITLDGFSPKTKGGQPIDNVTPYEALLQNKNLGFLVGHLNLKYLQHLDKVLIDQTGYNKPLDLHLQCNMSDIESIKAALIPHGLDIIETTTEQEFLVISKNQISSNQIP
ncbi:TlpA family protein disulfide reductase [Belliella sp. DSM 111904]|uniref:TlpA family protein disulfide reductase n=1 Tax=Belliella filtrata TaxID=2923435 RepID=A0ABS9UVH8_9BACT|nr:TlpA family protein disulfide reductase [Belliella filtrata]MCH7408141.1 TlpA family protein disulfide reductase [Belliella filtrata]